MSERYAQLTYTSSDRSAHAGTPATPEAGGWQIQYASADLAETEVEFLLAGVRTSFVTDPPLPDYPTPEQLAAGPRRLAYRRRRDGAAGYWHTVPAGIDGTGRPGNVFAHVVLDRTPQVPPLIRPIQRWRSEDWLTPFGAAAVTQARVPSRAPGPADGVTADSVVEFALDTRTWRLGTLMGLLDATAAALDGGAPVVLGAVSPDTAAQWIGLVSFLMSAGTATRLCFSTFDRADQLTAALEGQQHLTAVPLGDLPALPDGVVVIDETATLSLGELGGTPHRTAVGQLITVTEWSVLAQEALLDPGAARWVLTELDQHAAAAGDGGLHPAWPLAATIAGHDRFADAHPEARTVLAEHAVDGLDPDSDTGRVVADAMTDFLGVDTEDVWQVVSRGIPGPAGELAAQTYLSRAVLDDEWLDRPGPVPVPAQYFSGRPVPAGVRTAVEQAIPRAAAVGAHRLLTLAALLSGAGIDDDRLGDTLGEVVGAELADPQAGPALVQRCAEHRIPLWPRLMAGAGALRVAGHRDGHSGLADTVLHWLAEDLTMPGADELGAAQQWDPVWLRAALCGAQADRAGIDGPDRLWWLSICRSSRRDQVAGSRVWEPGLLLVSGAGSLGAAAIPTLLGAPDSDNLMRLADEVIAANTDDTAVACAVARAWSPDEWVSSGYLDSHQRAYLGRWDAATAALATPLHEDAAVRLGVLCAMGDLRGYRHPSGLGALVSESRCTRRIAEVLIGLVDAAVVAGPDVLAAGMLWARDGEPDSRDGVFAAFTVAADRLARTRDYDEDDEEAAVAAMVRLGDDDGAASPRRYRKMVHKLVARRADAQPAPAARTWRTR